MYFVEVDMKNMLVANYIFEFQCSIYAVSPTRNIPNIYSGSNTHVSVKYCLFNISNDI